METNISEETKKKLSIIRGLNFFKPFTNDEILMLLNECTWLKCNNGETIFQEGNIDNSFYVILKGSVSVRKKGAGVYNLAKIEAGECFGEMAVITGEQRSADVVTNEESYILKISANTLNRESNSVELKLVQGKFYKIFSQILANRLTSTSNRIVSPNSDRIVSTGTSKWKRS
jgi:serine/threonine-protein kinase